MNPNFPIITHAIWTQRPDDIIYMLHAETASQAAEGKTDDVPNLVLGPEQSPVGSNLVSHVRRNWLDTDSANQWIAFNNQLQDNRLLSISIEST